MKQHFNKFKFLYGVVIFVITYIIPVVVQAAYLRKDIDNEKTTRETCFQYVQKQLNDIQGDVKQLINIHLKGNK